MQVIKIIMGLGICMSATVLADTAASEKKSPPLFTAYPGLEKKVPYLPLGTFPTPIHKAEKLGAILNIKNLYIKCDNKSGKILPDGTQLPGGNKVRKLEFLLADALYFGHDTVVTLGDAGSNHVAATTMYAKEVGLKTIALLAPQIPTAYTRRNLLLDLYFGADIRYYQSDALQAIALLKMAREYHEKGQQKPYLITFGGSNEVGAIGFVNAIFELKEQIKQGIMPEPDLLFVTLGSTGTAAGLIIGIKAAGLKTKVIPVRISGTPERKTTVLKDLIDQTSAYLHSLDETFPAITITNQEIELSNNFAGNQYAQITPRAAMAIELLNSTEGIKLEGTYTGKAFSALIDEALKENLKDKVVLFWDSFSSGEYKNFTSQVDYKKLPKELHRYFTAPLQQLDQGV